MPDAAMAGRPATPLDIRHLVIEGTDPHPSQANGLHNVARRLAREQLAAGDRAEIVFLRPPGREGAIDHDVPSRCLPLTGSGIAGRIVRLAPTVLSAMLEGHGPATVLHIHSGREPLLVGVGRALRRHGVPYAVTVHGRYSHLFDRQGRITRLMPALYLRLVERLALEGAAFVQGITAAECSLLHRLAPRARIVALPNAAYSSRLDATPPSPRRIRPSDDFPRFGFCGRYEIEHKGIDLLLEGFALYRRGGGHGRLSLFGTGPGRDRVTAMATNLGLGGAVDIDGPRFGEDKRRALAKWDFFVHPSRYDVLPTGCLEAALLGLPLIVSAETGLVEDIVRHGAGLPVDPLTATTVAAAMAAAGRRSPAEWAAMAANVQRMALAIGDWTDIAGRLRLLYQQAGRQKAGAAEAAL